MINFKEVFNRCLFRIKYNMTNQYQPEMEMKGIDYLEQMKHQMASEISKKMLVDDKIKIIEFNFLNQTEFHAELFVCDQKDLYEIFYSFNQLTEDNRKDFVKWLSRDEEEHQNQIRSDNLRKILEETYFPPSSKNI